MTFLDKCVPCKIGTIPMLVRVHGKDWTNMAIDTWIRVQYAENGNWETVWVTRVDPNGYFMADR